MVDEQRLLKAWAREQALKMLGPSFEQIRNSSEEERQKGVSEVEIMRKVSLVVTKVETEHRGKVPDAIVDEVITLLQEAALPSQASDTGKPN